MILITFLIFIVSCFLLLFAGKFLVKALARIARFLEWREFVLSFLVIAMASSIPNLFVGIISALHKAPLLSFGDVIGGNVIDLTLAIALPVLIAGEIQVQSRVAQKTSLFTMVCSILPLILILDGKLSKADGIVLILVFFFYLVWLFSEKERFKLKYKNGISPLRQTKMFFADVVKVFLGLVLLLLAANGIVNSATSLAKTFNLSLALIGIFIVGPGNALPELYFAIISAKRGESWLVLGDVMGAVIIPATLVLGIVALLHPIVISDFSPFLIACSFLFVSAVFFFWTIRTGRKITKREALFLFSLFIAFLIFEVLFGIY